MKPSRYNLFVRDGERVHAVNLLSRAVVELTIEAYQSYERLAAGEAPPEDPETATFVAMLRDRLFLLEESFDELAYIRLRVQQGRFDGRQLGLVIAPTMGCNFGCHYCFEDKTGENLAPEAEARIVALVASRLRGRDSFAVQWFGGEPLLALPVIERLSRAFLELTRRAGVSYAATVITNGSRMTAEVAALLHELGVRHAQVTLDGDQPLHDRTRFELVGQGSFQQILANVRASSPHLAVKLRVHVAPFNVASVEKLIDRLAAERLQAHVAEIYFAPLFDYRAGREGPSYRPDGKRFMTAESFASAQTQLLQRAASHGFRLPDFLDVSYGICTAVRDSTLVVDPRGNLVKCYKDVGQDDEAVGTLESGETPGDNLLKWMDIHIPRDEECRECRFLPVCLGGCTKQWHEGAPKTTICTPLKFNADDRIRLTYGGNSIMSVAQD